jgi:hypothetical protein
VVVNNTSRKLGFAFLDIVGTLLLAFCALPFRIIARRRYWLPHFSRMSDRLGIHIRGSHYYEPTYREADLPERTDVERYLPGIDMNEAGQLALLAQFTFADELRAIPGVKPSAQVYGYSAPMYGPGDAEVTYSMIRHFKPRRIIEIGSGDSTLIARTAIDRNRYDDPAYDCHVLCIEPYEKPWLESIGIEVVRDRVENTDLAVFRKLQRNDMLLIDSSHVVRPWGDVLREFHEIIPTLAAGVLVHVHDIYTPRDYPERYLRQQRRLWNEQYLLEAYLAFNSRAKVLCAVNWLKNHHFDELSLACPVLAENQDCEPGAFWFLTA